MMIIVYNSRGKNDGDSDFAEGQKWRRQGSKVELKVEAARTKPRLFRLARRRELDNMLTK
jgi:hypothetical protein